jgi:exosortase
MPKNWERFALLYYRHLPASARVFSGEPVVSGEIVTRLSSDGVPTKTTKGLEYVEFTLLFVASIIFWWQPLTSTIKLALSSDSYTHILLILPISIALIVASDRHGFVFSSNLVKWPVLLLLLTALLVRVALVWGQVNLSASDSLCLSILALVLWWIGSVVACFGADAFRSHRFALCFLLLLVPLPYSALNWIVEALQNSSAAATEAMFRIAQVPVTRDGIILSIPGLDIEVARECSSIRSSTMLVVLTLVLAHLFLRSKWRKIALVLACLPLAIAKNAFRIFTITELATRVDPSYLEGKLHHQGGVVFLGIAVMITILLLWLLRKSESQADASPSLK